MLCCVLGQAALLQPNDPSVYALAFSNQVYRLTIGAFVDIITCPGLGATHRALARAWSHSREKSLKDIKANKATHFHRQTSQPL